MIIKVGDLGWEFLKVFNKDGIQIINCYYFDTETNDIGRYCMDTDCFYENREINYTGKILLYEDKTPVVEFLNIEKPTHKL